MYRIALLVVLTLLTTLVSSAQAAFKVSPATASFTYQLGDSKLPASVSLGITIGGSTQYSISATATGGPWLTVSPDTAKTPATLKISVNPTSLPIGTYSGSITISSSATGAPSPVTVPVTMTIKSAPASLSVTPNPVTVTYTRGGAPVSTQYLTLSGNGALLSYTVSVSGATWLSATASSGILFPGFTSSVGLDIDPTNLIPGSYKGTVTVSAPTASNKSQAIPVNLTVYPGQAGLTSVWPTRALVGAAATTITLSGSNFYSGSVVTANGATISSTYLGPNSIQAVIPVATLATSGTLSLAVSNADPGGGDSPTVNFQILPPGPQILGITDAASFVAGPVAPGEMVAIFGSTIGPDTLTAFVAPTPPATIATNLAGVRILFNSIPAPLIFVWETQVVAMVPYSVVPGSTIDVVAEYNSVQSAAYSVDITDAAPSLFTLGSNGLGQAAAFNVDEVTGALTLNADTAAVPRGGVITLYGTGAGVTTPAGTDGSIVPSPAPVPVGAVSVQIAGQDATVLYAGGAPGLVDGMFQLNLRVPTGIAAGKATPITVTVGTATSPAGVTISVK